MHDSGGNQIIVHSRWTSTRGDENDSCIAAAASDSDPCLD